MKLDKHSRAVLRSYFSSIGTMGGKIGGVVTASRLTPAERQSRASRAGLATAATMTAKQKRKRAQAAAAARWKKASAATQ